MSGPFATVEEFSEWTGIPIPVTGDEHARFMGRVQALLDSSSAAIRAHTGQILSEVVDDVISLVPWYPAYAVFLPQTPVTSVAVTIDAVPFTAFVWTSTGELVRTDNALWNAPIEVTYSHGYAETSDEFAILRKICIEAAARAFTLNERSASEAMGNTLMESAGYAPEVFLTEGEKASLPFTMAAVG